MDASPPTDAAAGLDLCTLPHQSSADQFRRSASIFSRRGTSTRQPAPFFSLDSSNNLAKLLDDAQRSWQAQTKTACVAPAAPEPSSASPKLSTSASTHGAAHDSKEVGGHILPKRLSLRSVSAVSDMSRASSNRSSLSLPSRSSKGTILNAVPPAKTIQMSPLEEEMATSPNEEIMSAISHHTSSTKPTPSSPRAAAASLVSLRASAPPSLSVRSQSRKRKDQNSRIGVWVDGVTQWDEGVLETSPPAVVVDSETGFTAYRPLPLGEQLAAQLAARKPNLSLLTPGGSVGANHWTAFSVVHPQPRRTRASTASASPISRPCRPPQTMVPEKARQTLGMSADMGRPVSPPEQVSASGSLDDSRSSASSVFGANEDVSSCSRSSSATSLDNSTGQRSTDGKTTKPLPPLPWLGDGVSVPTYKPYRPNSALPAPSIPEKRRSHTSSCRRSIDELNICDRDFLLAAPQAKFTASSPTLSQAEQELRSHLATIPQEDQHYETPLTAESAEDSPCKDNDHSLQRKSSASKILEPHARAPSIPKRSRRREWRASSPGIIPTPPALLVPNRRKSEAEIRSAAQADRSLSGLKSSNTWDPSCDRIPTLVPSVVVDAQSTEPQADTSDEPAAESAGPEADVATDADPETCAEQAENATRDASARSGVYGASAENVLLRILASLNSPSDLFNTAVINKGMYRVYKENEMYLLRTVAYNQSPAAFEYREWSPPGRADGNRETSQPQLEHDPITYMRSYRRGVIVIARLKKHILHNCQTFIRRETAAALSDSSHPSAQRFDDAFWRIWCFCKIFGCNKGREDDISGQLDWLQGGTVSHTQSASATPSLCADFDMSSVLLNAPEHFARANAGGLSAAQLFDMTEIWTCMAALLQPYHERADQARRHGVFDCCDIPDDGADEQETETAFLEEWTAYLLTLGPLVVLTMAQHADRADQRGFDTASRHGWTRWAPPAFHGSRTSFLKEPVSRRYEERVAAHNLRLQDPRELQKKELSRRRVARLAAEIRVRRQSSAYRRQPLIAMSQERPMSVLSRTDSASSGSGSLRLRRGPAGVASPASLWEPPRALFRPIPEEAGDLSPLGLSPEDLDPDFDPERVDDPSDEAVRRIVAMGFSPTQAASALRRTDPGDGLRIEHAVDLLLQEAEE